MATYVIVIISKIVSKSVLTHYITSYVNRSISMDEDWIIILIPMKVE